MNSEIPFLTTFLAGTISFLSPCVLPLVPPYFVYMTGISLEELSGDKTSSAAQASEGTSVRRTALTHSLLFVLGFGLVFTLLGAGASSIGQVLRANLDILAMLAGIVIIIMGLHFLGVFRIGLLFREARFRAGGSGKGGSFLMGLAFAFGWTPCIGPVLGAILALAAGRESAAEGAALLATYSAGLGIPFIIAAAFIGPFMGFLARFRRHLGTVEKIMGALLVVTGILFLTGGMQRFSFWLLETFPVLGTLG